MKKNKLGFFAAVGLVAVASLFTVCKATGASDYHGETGGQGRVWNVTFDTAGGVPEPEQNPVTVVDGGTLGVLPEVDPAKDGRIFSGWYLDLKGDEFDPATPVTQDITILAKWLRPEWTTFVYNETGIPADDRTVSLGDDAIWRDNTAQARLGQLSTLSNPDSKLSFNSEDYEKQYIRSIIWGRDAEGVTVLGDGFLVCFTGLTSLDLSVLEGLTGTGNYFLAMTGLTKPDLSALSEVTSIGDYFLGVNAGLTELDLSALSKLGSIGDNFLFQCTELKSISLPTLAAPGSIGDYFMFHCDGLLSIDLSPFSEATSIGYFFLSGCSSIRTLTLSTLSKLTSIGSAFLSECSSIDSLTLPPLPELVSVGGEFVGKCDALKTITLPSLPKLVSIGPNFLEYCVGLRSLTLPSMPALVSIDISFLHGCTLMTSVDMGTVSYDKIAVGDSSYTYSFDLASNNVCAVKVQGTPGNWTSKFTEKSAGVTFSN
jgi:hypothetical protein